MDATPRENSSQAVKWPATREELKAAGYVDTNSSRWCSCGELMFWFTTPKKPDGTGGKFIPLSILSDLRFEPHHAKCRNVKNFQHANQVHRDRVESKKPVQGKLQF
jgi:hypothetical protein